MTAKKNDFRDHLHLINSQSKCQHCKSRELCVLFDLDQKTNLNMSNFIYERGPFIAGDVIYRQADPFRALYSIQSGSAKAETVTLDRRSSVVDFFYQGDLAGLGAIGSSSYSVNLVALEKTWVCEIPYQKLLDVCQQSPTLYSRFLSRMGSTLLQHEQNWKILCNDPVEIRVMRFLYDLQKRGSCNESFLSRVELPMTRQDLASYLSITPESLSRTLTRMQREGYLDKKSHRVLMLKKPLMEKLGFCIGVK